MRYIFYHYNNFGMLVLDYSDEKGEHKEHCYLYYSLREAISKFRKDNRLQYKHIKIAKLC